jgi:hypothetical protein
MPIPTPTPEEDHSTFMHRCMVDEKMMEEYPNVPQRFAVCLTSWKANSK